MLGTDIIARMGPYQLLHHYLSASYCYYQLDLSPLTDAAYDLLCKRLHDTFDQVSDDPHSSLVTLDDLAAGSGFSIPEESYPSRVKMTAHPYYNSCISGEMAKRLESFLPPARPMARRVRVGRTPPVVAPKRVGRSLPAKTETPVVAVKRVGRTIR